MLSIAALPSLANSAEISSSNLRSGNAAFDNVKASWNQALKLGDFSTKLQANYDYNANKDFIKDVSLRGDLIEAGKDDDLSVAYEVSHSFADKNTNVKLAANMASNNIGVEYDQSDGLKEVSLNRDVDLAGQDVNVQPSWLVQAQSARVKLMSRLNGGDRLSAQADISKSGDVSNVEVGYDHNLQDGRDLSATLKSNKQLDVDLVDNKFESGATWTASASVGLENSNDILDNAKLTLKRAWAW